MQKKYKKKYAFIFARKGSKGIQNKNLKKINGKSLIEISILQCKKASLFDEIYVSSNSDKILNIAKKLNVKTIKRPNNLSDDKAKEIDAWKHAIQFLLKRKIKFDLFFSIPCTSPLRKIIDIKKSYQNFVKYNPDILVTGCKSKRNPYFNILEKKKNFYKIVLNKKDIYRRQDAPQTFDMATVCFISTPKYILGSKNLIKGKIFMHQVDEISAIDIDNKIDLKIAKILFDKKK